MLNWSLMLVEKIKNIFYIFTLVSCALFCTGASSACLLAVQGESIASAGICTGEEIKASVTFESNEEAVSVVAFVLIVIGFALISLFVKPKTTGRSKFVHRKNDLAWLWAPPWPFSKFQILYLPYFYARAYA